MDLVLSPELIRLIATVKILKKLTFRETFVRVNPTDPTRKQNGAVGDLG